MSDESGTPTVSVVAPACNEADSLGTLHARIALVLGAEHEDWELVVVDDGSTDATWSVLKDLHASDPRVRALRLSRNFGHQNALVAGLEAARGDAVISIDADLQQPPALIADMLREWRAGAMIVKSRRRDTVHASHFKRLSSRAFYRVFSYMSGVSMQAGLADFRLLDRRVLGDLLAFGEQELFLRGLVEWVGYPQTTVDYTLGPRHAGRSKYGLRRMLGFAWHGISAFSLVPLRIGVTVGFGSSALAFLAALYAIGGKLLSGGVVPGWASTVAIVSIFFAILFAYLALLGEYLGRVLIEVRGRPRYLVSERIGAPECHP